MLPSMAWVSPAGLPAGHVRGLQTAWQDWDIPASAQGED